MANKESEPVKFTHETKFEVSKFPDYSFNEPYKGAVFATCHNGVDYKWRVELYPLGSKYRNQLDNGQWSDFQEDRNNLRYYLQFLGGPLSAVNAEYTLKVKPMNEESDMIRPKHCDKVLFIETLWGCWGNSIATKEKLDQDGYLANGFLKVVVEIKIDSCYFDPLTMLENLKHGITKEEENVTPVPSFFFDSIDAEPAFGLPLQLVVGAEQKIFFCLHQILEQNSAYFANLLHASPDFKENKDSKINLPEKDPQGVRAALCYLYTKKLPENFKEVAQVCLPAAHLFLLPGLVLECEKVLIGELSAENDFDMVIVAETYNLKLLKNMAMNSLVLRYDDLMENEDIVEKLKSVDLFGQLVKLVAMRVRCVAGHVL